MGFRDLKAFNIALLAKQGWRLQNCPNSVFHRVYKAKYFPYGDFLTALLGRQPSYSWRSIMEAQKVVQLGCRWYIGNGGSVSCGGINGCLPCPCINLQLFLIFSLMMP